MSGRGEVERIDPHDERAVTAWHATYAAAERHGRPAARPYTLTETLAAAQTPSVAFERRMYRIVDGGRTLAAGELVLPQKDNLTTAEVRVHVHPDDRRRGHGSRMLDRLHADMAGAGRTVAHAMVTFPYECGPSGEGDPGVAFALAHGYAQALTDVQRALRGRVPAERLDELAASCAPHHRDYRLRSFLTACPDDLVEGYGALVGTLVTEAPTGDLVVESEVFDEERLRSQEAQHAATGRTPVVTVACTETGEPVAFTEIMVPSSDRGVAYQWGTLVRPDHRGHRLGLALKVANHRLLQERFPDVAEVVTFNAEVNDHMIAVNEALGFEPVGRLGEFQRSLG